MATDESVPVAPELRIHRPFNWGIVMLCDERVGGPPPPASWPRTTPGQPSEFDHVAVNGGGITVRVRHAQDVDLDGLADDDEPEPFEVQVVCWRGRAPRDVASVAVATIAIPSARLSIGDAERDDVVDGPPGDWLVEVSGSPSEYPERLDVWFSPADAE